MVLTTLKLKNQVSFLILIGENIGSKYAKEWNANFTGDVHTTHHTRIADVWIAKQTQKLQPTLGGRDRVIINAIINAKDPNEVIVEACKTPDTQTTKAFYQKIIEANPVKKDSYLVFW